MAVLFRDEFNGTGTLSGRTANVGGTWFLEAGDPLALDGSGSVNSQNGSAGAGESFAWAQPAGAAVGVYTELSFTVLNYNTIYTLVGCVFNAGAGLGPGNREKSELDIRSNLTFAGGATLAALALNQVYTLKVVIIDLIIYMYLDGVLVDQRTMSALAAYEIVRSAGFHAYSNGSANFVKVHSFEYGDLTVPKFWTNFVGQYEV